MKRGFFVAIAASLAAMGVSAQSREVSTTGEGEPFETRDTITLSLSGR